VREVEGNDDRGPGPAGPAAHDQASRARERRRCPLPPSSASSSSQVAPHDMAETLLLMSSVLRVSAPVVAMPPYLRPHPHFARPYDAACSSRRRASLFARVRRRSCVRRRGGDGLG
jgi:hypothetical protein